MASVIPDQYLDFFQKRAFANLATLMPDGTPQVTPVWVDWDGTHILINSARGRQKDKNMQRSAASRCPSSIPTIPIATSRCAARLPTSAKTARTTTSTRWPRSTWAKTNTPYRRQGEVRVVVQNPAHQNDANGLAASL